MAQDNREEKSGKMYVGDIESVSRDCLHVKKYVLLTFPKGNFEI